MDNRNNTVFLGSASMTKREYAAVEIMAAMVGSCQVVEKGSHKTEKNADLMEELASKAVEAADYLMMELKK